MEEVLLRFPQIGKKIFEELNNQSLMNCRKVNESWRKFIDGEKTVSFRIIKVYTNVPDTYLHKKFGRANLNVVRELAKKIQHVYRISTTSMYNYEESKGICTRHLLAQEIWQSKFDHC